MFKETVFFIAKDQLYQFAGGKLTEMESQYLAKYRHSLAQIQKRSAWKTSGSGAQFMGMSSPASDGFDVRERSAVTAVVPVEAEKIVYALNTDVSTGLYTKNPQDHSEVEGFIIRSNDFQIFELDYFPATGEIAASVSESHLGRSLAMFHEDTSDYHLLTEGAALDRNPCFSLVDDRLFYDSCGILLNEQQLPVGVSKRSVLSLDLETGDVKEEVEQDGFDCYRPKVDAQGNLYYIRRPEQKPDQKNVTAKDVALMPGKVGKAMFGWLNYFTQRYSGESLSSGGANPSKAKQKSNEEMFIEGNLVNVAQTLKENQGLNEKYPGIAPKSWELVKRTPAGAEAVLKKGVLDFAVTNHGDILYSNGKHLVHREKGGGEELLASVDLAVNIQVGG